MAERDTKKEVVYLGNGKKTEVLYSSDFDPSPIRARLGLDGHAPAKMSLIEKSRQATMLWKHGYLTLREIGELGGWRVPDKNYSGDEGVAGNFDPPPCAENKHLQR